MNIKYIALSLVLILLGAGLFLLPDRKNFDELKPDDLLAMAGDRSLFLSTDLIASRMIDKDPSLFLIDVRTPDQYEYFSLPGAVNIPLEEILNPEWEDYLEQDGVDVVFYSNGNILADQAWMICKRSHKQDIFIMKGGLNCWFETIMQPPVPPSTAPSEAFDLYQFRKGACQYFGGGSQAISGEPAQEAVKVSRKKKKSAVEGGC